MFKFMLIPALPECEICGKDLFNCVYGELEGKLVCFSCYMIPEPEPEPEPKPTFCEKCRFRRPYSAAMGCCGDLCASNPVTERTYLHEYLRNVDCELKNNGNCCQEFEKKITKFRKLSRLLRRRL